MDDVPPVNNEVILDDDDLGVSEINLDDDDDIFKSARLEPEPAKMIQEPEVVKSNGGGAVIQEPVVSSGAALTNGHHKDQARAESEEPVETDIPLEVIMVIVSFSNHSMMTCDILDQDDDDRPFDNAHLKPGLQLQSEPATISVPHQTLTSFNEACD